MAPKKSDGDKNFSLEKWTPTEEELQAARSILKAQDGAKKRSSTACMVAFVQKGDATLAHKLKDIKGADRQEYVARYLAYMAKKKAGTLTATSAHSSESDTTTDYHFWCKWQLEQAVGSVKAAHWIDNKLVDKYGDRLSGDMSEELCEYMVPVAWLRSRESSKDSLKLESEQQATKEDVQNLRSLQLRAPALPTEVGIATGKPEAPEQTQVSKDGVATPLIKQEQCETNKEPQGITVDDKKNKIIKFLAQPTDWLKVLQGIELEAIVEKHV